MQKNEYSQTNVSFSDKEAILMGELQPHSFYWNLKKRVMNFLLEKFVDPGDLIIDVGCGTGYLIPNWLPVKARYIGLDAVVSSLEQCKKNVAEAEAFHLGDLREIEHLRGEIDMVL